LAAIALGKYTAAVFPAINETHLAGGTVVVITAIHSYSIRTGSLFQISSTLVKILLILVFIAAALLISEPQSISLIPKTDDLQLITSPGFAVALIYVSYAYTGWNAAIYIAGEVQDPARNLPKALFNGTLLVLVLYVGLNYVFLYSVPMMELVDVVEVGFLSATRIFGQSGGELMSMVISLLLVSTVSAMVFVGPRISMTIGEDMPMFAILGRKGANGIPVNAIIFQMVVTLLFIYTSTFEQVLIYASFMLTLFTSLTVFGVFVLRWKNPGLARPYKTWGYPYTPLIYVILSTWIMIYVFLDKTTETLIGLGIGAVGLVLYLINKLWFSRNHKIIKNEH
jgi:APA family basic amino acid/polyamine antiporter